MSTATDLKEQFEAAFSAVLLPDHNIDSVVQRISGETDAPTKDDEVRSEAIRTAHMIAQIDANIAQLKERQDALAAKKKQAETLRTMLRGDITGMLVRNGLKKAQDADISVKLRKLPDAMNVTITAEQMEASNPEFIRVKKEVNKAEIKKHIKATGEIIEGVELVEGGHTVAIEF